MAKAKIERLTPEREAELPKFRQRYLDIASNGARIDRAALESALADAYALIGKPAPKLFIFDSPAACMLALKIFKLPPGQLRGQLWGQLGDQLWGQLWGQLRGQLGGQLWGQLGDQLWGQKIYDPNYLWGSQDLFWIAWARFAQSVGVVLKPDTDSRLGIMERISTQCEWWWPSEHIVIASERPKVRWDGEGRLHCETGPAVEYADGYGLYAWRGLAIPSEWITDGPPAADKIMRIENIEQRRIAAEMRGWHNVIPALPDAKMIDRHPNPQVGELWQATLPDHGAERFLQVKCGTGRTFAIPVGMEFSTAREANAATYGIAPQILDQLEIRT